MDKIKFTGELGRWLTGLLLLICNALAIDTLSFAEVVVYSRNMPKTCQFVFQVESDIVITGSSPLQSQRDQPKNLTYYFYDTWNKTWTEPVLVQIEADANSAWQVRLSLESMSVAKDHLYRIIYFTINYGLPEISQTRSGPEQVIYKSEFGREFTEPCYSDGRESTPFRQRRVEVTNSGSY